MSDELPTQTHIAAPSVRFREIIRQRCLWCGALIEEWDLTRISRPLESGEDPDAQWEPSVWPAGALVRASGTSPRIKTTVEPETLEDGSEKAPDDCCMMLDSAVV